MTITQLIDLNFNSEVNFTKTHVSLFLINIDLILYNYYCL